MITPRFCKPIEDLKRLLSSAAVKSIDFPRDPIILSFTCNASRCLAFKDGVKTVAPIWEHLMTFHYRDLQVHDENAAADFGIAIGRSDRCKPANRTTVFMVHHTNWPIALIADACQSKMESSVIIGGLQLHLWSYRFTSNCEALLHARASNTLW